MPCFKPLQGWRGRLTAAGKRGIVFNPEESPTRIPVEVPCGQCIGCRLERSRQWAVRCMHEASLHENNCFITLTYNDECLPDNNSLDKSHFQKFMKRLRKRFKSDTIRYFQCGEYGEKLSRPHYHACLFGFDFPDKEVFRVSNGMRLYTSQILGELWPFGFSTIGDVTFESAAYVARYVTKKITGDAAEEHYTRVILETGEIVRMQEEYVTMSRRPGIAAGWFEKFGAEVFPSDEVIVRGTAVKPPRFYEKLFEAVHGSDVLMRVKDERVKRLQKRKEDCTPERLKVREIVTSAKLNRFKRGFENDS